MAPWDDLGQKASQDLETNCSQKHILDGGSLLITGSPGVGKSYFAKDLVRSLVDAGKCVTVIAKTHAACANFNKDLEGAKCITADHWVRATVRRGVCHSDCIVVEEASQISTYLWNDIAKAAWMCKQFIVLGDPLQFPATCDVWAGCPVTRSLWDSDLLYELCGARRLCLTENMRSDPELFGFYTNLCDWSDQPPLEAARQQFPVKAGTPRYHLVLSHARRMVINSACNQRERKLHKDAVLFRSTKTTEENKPQNMWIWVGQELIGAGGKCKKGIFFTVTEASPERVVVDDISLPRDSVCASLRLSHAITYHSAQGLTLPGRVRLCELDSPHATVTHHSVGSSRVTAAN